MGLGTLLDEATLLFMKTGRQTCYMDLDYLSHGQVVYASSSDSFLDSSLDKSRHPVDCLRPQHRPKIMLTVIHVSAPVDSAEYARSVREDTAELASYFLSDKKSRQSPNFLTRPRSQSLNFRREGSPRDPFWDDDEVLDEANAGASDTIVEVSEPPSPDEEEDGDFEEHDGPSILTNMLRRSPPESYQDGPGLLVDPSFGRKAGADGSNVIFPAGEDILPEEATENTPLIRTTSARSGRSRRSTPRRQNGNSSVDGTMSDDLDVEGQFKRPESSHWLIKKVARLQDFARANSNPKVWNGKAVVHALFVPVKCLPAVLVGLILNILDALSYGMILFPLGNPIFANLGPAGISMFYVSTIVSQVVFSTGSIFKGGVGSELIEVVPFFHSMAAKITANVGEENPDAVIATTIFCFCFSSLITGAVFFTMGQLKFGNLVGFIPRHILIGCIGGVGWFLVQTGFEVSARLEGSFRYDLETLSLMFRANTVPLWTIPLGLAIVLFVMSTTDKLKDNHYVLPVFICLEPAIFWFFVTALDSLSPEPLREKGWIFEAPPAGESWWFFYTLFSRSRPPSLIPDS